MSRNRVAEHLAHDACGFLSCGLFARRNADKAAGLEREGIDNSVFPVLKELRNAACKLALFIDLEPVGLRAGLNLNIGAELIYLLARQLVAAYDDSFDGIALGKGRKFRTLDKLGYVLDYKVNAQIRLILAVLFH